MDPEQRLNRALHLILMPTEACNFRCVYCYERFEHHRMKPAVVRGVKNLMSRRAQELDRLGVSWFGGEPLLARDVIEEVMLHAHSLKEKQPGLLVAGDMTTNAYLLDRDCFERLLDLGVTHLQIAFDGPPEHHDRKRVLAGGKGTFDRIWKNILSCRDVDRTFEILVRVHVDRENAGDIPRFWTAIGKRSPTTGASACSYGLSPAWEVPWTIRYPSSRVRRQMRSCPPCAHVRGETDPPRTLDSGLRKSPACAMRRSRIPFLFGPTVA
jgi:sulfatase maturation enzyme AslB (radical SAM superfamily)